MQLGLFMELYNACLCHVQASLANGAGGSWQQVARYHDELYFTQCRRERMRVP